MHGLLRTEVSPAVIVRLDRTIQYSRDIEIKSRSRGVLDTPLEHDPEKWVPVFRKDHAQTKR